MKIFIRSFLNTKSVISTREKQGRDPSETCPDYVDLMTRRIEKEGSILFYMAEDMRLKTLRKSKSIRAGTDAFLELLDRLQQAYSG